MLQYINCFLFLLFAFRFSNYRKFTRYSNIYFVLCLIFCVNLFNADTAERIIDFYICRLVIVWSGKWTLNSRLKKIYIKLFAACSLCEIVSCVKHVIFNERCTLILQRVYFTIFLDFFGIPLTLKQISESSLVSQMIVFLYIF